MKNYLKSCNFYLWQATFVLLCFCVFVVLSPKFIISLVVFIVAPLIVHSDADADADADAAAAAAVIQLLLTMMMMMTD